VNPSTPSQKKLELPEGFASPNRHRRWHCRLPARRTTGPAQQDLRDPLGHNDGPAGVDNHDGILLLGHGSTEIILPAGNQAI